MANDADQALSRDEDNVQIGLVVPKSMKNELMKEAKKENTSLSAVARRRLVKA